MGSTSNGVCAVCGGRKSPGTTLFATEIGEGVLVVRGVPALVCGQCGEEWIDDDVAGQLEAMAADARVRRVQLEVVTFAEVG